MAAGIFRFGNGGRNPMCNNLLSGLIGMIVVKKKMPVITGAGRPEAM